MTMLQNQAPKGLPNVLHDQGVPNTLRGVGLPVPRALPRGLTIVATVVFLAALVTLLVLAFARLA